MEGPSTSLPGPTADVDARPVYPRWAAIALVLSGIFLMVVDTPDLLFFVGLVLTLVGLYVVIRRRDPR